MIKNIKEFAIALQHYHLDKPKLSIYFEDDMDDGIKELWQKMDKAILELIYKVKVDLLKEKLIGVRK